MASFKVAIFIWWQKKPLCYVCFDLWRINVKFLIVTTVFKTAVTSATNQLATNGQRFQIDIEQIYNLF